MIGQDSSPNLIKRGGVLAAIKVQCSPCSPCSPQRSGSARLRASLDGRCARRRMMVQAGTEKRRSNRTKKHMQKIVSVDIQPVHTEECWHEGRGPELRQVHYDDSGTVLRAIDYSNPDGNKRHLIFVKPQIFMFTPEEVENYGTSAVNWTDTGRAALVCVSRSPWLASFAPYHLKECLHFRVMFYDVFLDVICQEIAVQPGLYFGNQDA